MPALVPASAPLMNWPLHRALTIKRAERDRLAAALKNKAPRSFRAVELRARLQATTAELLELETKLRNEK